MSREMHGDDADGYSTRSFPRLAIACGFIWLVVALYGGVQMARIAAEAIRGLHTNKVTRREAS